MVGNLQPTAHFSYLTTASQQKQTSWDGIKVGLTVGSASKQLEQESSEGYVLLLCQTELRGVFSPKTGFEPATHKLE